MSDSPLILEARALVAAWRGGNTHQIRCSDADVAGVVRFLTILRESTMGQRAFAATVGISVSTLSAWLTGQRKHGAVWQALTEALGLQPWTKPAPKMTRHAVVCREYRLRKKARTLAERSEEYAHAA